MKIVVTGALGHIGSMTIRELANQLPGSEIVLIDSMMTQRYASLFNLPRESNYKFYENNLNDLDLIDIFNDSDYVIHLAAITDAAGSFEKASEVEKNNYESTKLVAEACLETNAKLITLSSTSVYGTQKTLVTEDCDESDLQPQSPYAETKLKEEVLIKKLTSEQNLKAVIFRFGTIFGISTGMRFHTAVNKFCWQAVMSKPITIWSTAYEQKRPYLDLADAVNALIFAIRSDLFDGKIYNVLTLNATVKQIVDCIKEFVPDLEISFVENKIMNQLSYEVSCDRFINEGFKFDGDLRKGIGETIKLLKQANSFN